ncbi:hypothetical protein D1BOALGB6SA_7294 [Olavius sp. associated proteobacterium Delta 1]|nr:hypothetical protein D1BOALGB6SA_7294 [Olavius sp. associated proteobacterium Delta 1]
MLVIEKSNKPEENKLLGFNCPLFSKTPWILEQIAKGKLNV